VTVQAVINDLIAHPVDVLLTEVEVDDAVFFGTVTTGSASGELAIARGDIITITYDDVVTALGSQEDRTVQTQVVDPFGDVDGNGLVQAYDAALVLLHRLSTMLDPPGAPVLVGLDSLSANVDLDAPYGIIDGFDASLILRRVVGLQPVFPVQYPASANHPQGDPAEKAIPEERLLVLREHAGYVSVWVEDRSGIVSGELVLSGMTGKVEMGDELGAYLSASRPTDAGLQVVFAGAEDVSGAGELLRVYGSVEGVEVDRVRFNDGSIIARIGESVSSEHVPMRFALHPNHPNPFNPETTIRYELSVASEVVLEVFDTVGQRVRVLEEDVLPAGLHEAMWDGLDEVGEAVSSGVYFYRLQAQGVEGAWRSDASRPADLRFSQVRRMLLLK